MLEVKNLYFTYKSADQEFDVLRDLNFRVEPGDFVAIQGPSGSGKSTLFYILGMMMKPTRGEFHLAGKNVANFSIEEQTFYRSAKIGFVFQQFHLLAKSTLLDNIMLPTRYPSESANPGPADIERAKKLAKLVGLDAHLHHMPNQVSGGQQQRVAIARALMKDVDLILADEPTGNLDSKNARQVLDLFAELNREGKTIVMITHDGEVAKRTAKVVHMRDGAFTEVIENFPAPGIAVQKAIAEAKERAKERTPSPAERMRSGWNILRSVFPLALENLVRNKVKSLLTMLGIVIGIAALLAMSTLGQFAKQRILESYESMGVNKLVIRGYRNWELRATDQVTTSFSEFRWDRDLQPLRRIFPEIAMLSPVLYTWNNSAISGGVTVKDKVTAIGITPEFLAISRRKLAAGRNITPFHVDSRSPVCLIGWDVAGRLFKRVNPIGQIIKITDRQKINYPCRVIGVLESMKTANSSSPPNLNVFMPYTYFQTSGVNRWDAQISEVALQVKPGADVEQTGKKIKAYYDRKYGRSGQFHIDSDSNLVAQMKRFLNMFALLLGAIALISLVVGGIGINNMMLVSVAERVKEFGLRKALGATNRSIRMQVLIESLCLCAAAGVLGVVFGFASYQSLIFIATKFVPGLAYEWIFEPLPIFLSVSSILIVGVVSGLVPAIRAEKLQVIEALRSE